MKHLATALAIVGCIASFSYCTIQEQNNHHDLIMWCLQHNGHINNWNGQCELEKKP